MGGFLDQHKESIQGYSSVMNNEIAESTAYMVGHVACAIAFPEVTLARDFAADIYRGDPIAVALDSLGYLGPVRNLLKTSSAIPALIEKSPQEVNAGKRVMDDS